MRLWIFNFDGTITSDGNNRSMAALHPDCAAMLSRLSAIASDQVVIISDRNVFVIVDRIHLPDAIVGGCDGIEWILPRGTRIGPFRDHEDDLVHSRITHLPELYKIVGLYHGIIEDNIWSVTVHTKKNGHNKIEAMSKQVRAWAAKHGLTVNTNDGSFDISLIEGFNRSIGISFLAKMFKLNPAVDSIVYAGSGNRDVIALWWTLLTGGTAIMVKNDLDVPGAVYVEDPHNLIILIDELIERVK